VMDEAFPVPTGINRGSKPRIVAYRRVPRAHGD